MDRPFFLPNTMNAVQHDRKPLRLKDYDYASNGAYFVTICAQDRRCIFGHIERGNLIRSEAGMMIERIWNEIPSHYQGIEIDAFQLMPNHIHGVFIVGAGPRACPELSDDSLQLGQPQGVAPTKQLSLPDIVHRFKSITTNRYIEGVKTSCWPPFNKRLWQRNYYEHVIRNDDDLNEIRQYIIDNPLKWELDSENPINKECKCGRGGSRAAPTDH